MTKQTNVPVVVEGSLGWGNGTPPKGRTSTLQLWGPGGRWQKPRGHHIEDALEEAGCGEGATVICVAVDRFVLSQHPMELLRDAIENAVQNAITDELDARSKLKE